MFTIRSAYHFLRVAPVMSKCTTALKAAVFILRVKIDIQDLYQKRQINLYMVNIWNRLSHQIDYWYFNITMLLMLPFYMKGNFQLSNLSWLIKCFQNYFMILLIPFSISLYHRRFLYLLLVLLLSNVCREVTDTIHCPWALHPHLDLFIY